MICPQCRQDVAPSPVGFTWWGGIIGPKLLSHVECPACKARFNGKSGQPNTVNLAIYTAVLVAIAGGLFYFGAM